MYKNINNLLNLIKKNNKLIIIIILIIVNLYIMYLILRKNNNYNNKYFLENYVNSEEGVVKDEEDVISEDVFNDHIKALSKIDIIKI